MATIKTLLDKTTSRANPLSFHDLIVCLGHNGIKCDTGDNGERAEIAMANGHTLYIGSYEDGTGNWVGISINPTSQL